MKFSRLFRCRNLTEKEKGLYLQYGKGKAIIIFFCFSNKNIFTIELGKIEKIPLFSLIEEKYI